MDDLELTILIVYAVVLLSMPLHCLWDSFRDDKDKT